MLDAATDFNPAQIEAEREAERWRPIRGREVYEVSDMGRVRSWWNKGGNGTRGMGKKSRVLALQVSSNGYVKVRLYRGSHSKGEEAWVHRLVLSAFVSEPEERMEAHHLDGRGTNNRLANLKWVGASENCFEREKARAG